MEYVKQKYYHRVVYQTSQQLLIEATIVDKDMRGVRRRRICTTNGTGMSLRAAHCAAHIVYWVTTTKTTTKHCVYVYSLIVEIEHNGWIDGFYQLRA